MILLRYPRLMLTTGPISRVRHALVLYVTLTPRSRKALHWAKFWRHRTAGVVVGHNRLPPLRGSMNDHSRVLQDRGPDPSSSHFFRRSGMK
jgi:hypothetical protein